MLRQLQLEELMWLKKMFEPNFSGKKQLLEQLKYAKVTPKYYKGYISLKFHIDSNIEKFPYQVRNPIEMRAFQEKKVPVVFLLHVINGYLDELEIFKADSSGMSNDFTVENVELVINPKLKVIR